MRSAAGSAHGPPDGRGSCAGGSCTGVVASEGGDGATSTDDGARDTATGCAAVRASAVEVLGASFTAAVEPVVATGWAAVALVLAAGAFEASSTLPDDVAAGGCAITAGGALGDGDPTYLDDFAAGPLAWYPAWALDLGAPQATGTTATDLLQGGVYRRDFAKGSARVNPSPSPVTVTLGATMQQVVPMGGGAIDAAGDTPGSITMTPVTSVTVPATGAVIVLQ
jgi:hypothetical protein